MSVAGSENSDHLLSGNSGHLPVALPGQTTVGESVSDEGKDDRDAEAAVTTVDNAAERIRRQVGRAAKAEAYRDIVVQALTDDPTLRSVELLHRARLAGCTGGKSAWYLLAQTLRAHTVTPLVRFEGLPAEFSQHDFGEVIVRYASLVS